MTAYATTAPIPSTHSSWLRMLTPPTVTSVPGKVGKPLASGPQMRSMTAFTAVDTPNVRMIEVSGVIFLTGAMVIRSRSTAIPMTSGMTTEDRNKQGQPGADRADRGQPGQGGILALDQVDDLTNREDGDEAECHQPVDRSLRQPGENQLEKVGHECLACDLPGLVVDRDDHERVLGQARSGPSGSS
jgi:hypothetical protein